MATKKKASSKKAAAKKASAARGAAQKSPAKKAPARKSSAQKSPAKKAVTKKKASSKKASANKSAKKAPAKTPAKAAGQKAPAKKKAAANKAAKGSSFSQSFLDSQREALLAERSRYTQHAEFLQAEADQLAREREPGDVQFDEESGEGDSIAVGRDRDLQLSAQALAAIEVGQRLIIGLRLADEDEELVLNCRVVSVVSAAPRPGLGVEFLFASSAQRAALAAAVAAVRDSG